jgi:hypothetical protein
MMEAKEKQGISDFFMRDEGDRGAISPTIAVTAFDRELVTLAFRQALLTKPLVGTLHPSLVDLAGNMRVDDVAVTGLDAFDPEAARAFVNLSLWDAMFSTLRPGFARGPNSTATTLSGLQATMKVTDLDASVGGYNAYENMFNVGELGRRAWWLENYSKMSLERVRDVQDVAGRSDAAVETFRVRRVGQISTLSQPGVQTLALQYQMCKHYAQIFPPIPHEDDPFELAQYADLRGRLDSIPVSSWIGDALHDHLSTFSGAMGNTSVTMVPVPEPLLVEVLGSAFYDPSSGSAVATPQMYKMRGPKGRSGPAYSLRSLDLNISFRKAINKWLMGIYDQAGRMLPQLSYRWAEWIPGSVTSFGATTTSNTAARTALFTHPMTVSTDGAYTDEPLAAEAEPYTIMTSGFALPFHKSDECTGEPKAFGDIADSLTTPVLYDRSPPTLFYQWVVEKESSLFALSETKPPYRGSPWDRHIYNEEAFMWEYGIPANTLPGLRTLQDGESYYSSVWYYQTLNSFPVAQNKVRLMNFFVIGSDGRAMIPSLEVTRLQLLRENSGALETALQLGTLADYDLIHEQIADNVQWENRSLLWSMFSYWRTTEVMDYARFMNLRGALRST